MPDIKSESGRGGNNNCRLFKRCGGCQLSMDYAQQLLWKQERVERRFSRFAKPDFIAGMESPYNYRNKTTAVVRPSGGRIISGVFQSSTNSVVATDECMLEDRRSLKVVKILKELMRSFKISAYDPQTDRGVIKYFLIRKAALSGDLMVCIVSAPKPFPSKRAFVAELIKRCKDVKTVVLNISRVRDRLMLSDEQEILFGSGSIEDRLCGKRFLVSPRSFYQINHAQTEKLYNMSLDMAELKASDTMLDCYCGIGTIGIIASGRVKRVIGVEINPQAIADAKENVKLNNVSNAEFQNDDAGRFMQELAKAGERPNVVMLDPARAGCDKRFLQSLVKLSPERVVYISCNIETQERDVKYLCSNGYSVKRIAPVDMFPHTKHIENICLMTKSEKLKA